MINPPNSGLQIAAEALGEGEIQVDEDETVVMKKEDEPGPGERDIRIACDAYGSQLLTGSVGCEFLSYFRRPWHEYYRL